jgi:hypothetical protein
LGKAALGKADVEKAAVGKAAASPSTTISADLTSSVDHSTIAEIRVTEFRDWLVESQGLLV